jgi:hypothetical protein
MLTAMVGWEHLVYLTHLTRLGAQATVLFLDVVGFAQVGGPPGER